MVAGIVNRVDLSRICWVRDNPVKVHYGIESLAGPNPLVDLLSRNLSVGVRVPLPFAGKWCDGSPNGNDIPGMKAFDHLLVSPYYAVGEGILDSRVGGGSPEVVHSDVDDRVGYRGMCEDVTVETSEAVGSQAIVENAIPACRLVDYRQRAASRCDHSVEQEIWPTSRSRD